MVATREDPVPSPGTPPQPHTTTLTRTHTLTCPAPPPPRTRTLPAPPAATASAPRLCRTPCCASAAGDEARLPALTRPCPGRHWPGLAWLAWPSPLSLTRRRRASTQCAHASRPERRAGRCAEMWRQGAARVVFETEVETGAAAIKHAYVDLR